LTTVERVLQLVDERIRGPEDDIGSVVTREELAEVTRGYRRIAVLCVVGPGW
jgi:hypothetical protein